MPPTVLAATGVWLMRRWSWDQFEAAIRQICDYASPGPDWGTVANRIGRFLQWEFDDEYDGHVNAYYGTPFPPRSEET